MELKRLYKEYVLIYKKKIEEMGLVGPAECDQSCAAMENFLPVNRKDAYLIQSAARFARQFNMEEAVTRLYTGQEYTLCAQPKAKSKRQLKRRVYLRNPIKGEYILQWPIDKSLFWMSSKFGPRKKNKTSWKFHYGIDLAAIKGTPVKAAAFGKITEVMHGLQSANKGYGKTIVIDHNYCQTRYAHLDQIYVKLGDIVQAGQVIAAVGNSGFVMSKHGIDKASHLHFEVKEAGRHIDPLLVLA